MTKLTSLEQAAVADLKAKYDALSAEAKAEVAKGVSWAERNFWTYSVVLAVVAAVLGHLL